MNIHPDTTLTAGVLAIVVLIANVAIAYFNITGTIACTLANAAPTMQAAAAAAVGR